MKKFSFLVLLTICSLLAFGQSSMKDLQGRWQADDGSGIEILDSARIFLFYNNDKKPVIRYSTDFSKTPIWFDFTVKYGSEQFEAKSLFRLLDKKLLQWQIFEEKRPVNFDPAKEVIYLRRVN